MNDIFGYAQQLQQLLVLAYNAMYYDAMTIAGVGYALLFLIWITLMVGCYGVFKVASAIRELSSTYNWRNKDHE